MQLEIVRLGAVDGRAHLGARLDTELFGDALLKRGHRQHGGDHRHLASADHLEQVHALESVRVDHAAMTISAQLDSDFVIVAALDLLRDGCGAGARDVRRAEQADRGLAEHDVEMRLAGGFQSHISDAPTAATAKPLRNQLRPSSSISPALLRSFKLVSTRYRVPRN